MFKISPIEDKKTQKEYVELCGGKFREDFFSYAMVDNDTNELMGISQFEIEEGYGYISDIRPRPLLEDFEAMFILGRATMNFIDMCGAHKCKASITSGEEMLLKAIGFKEQNGEYSCDMAGMFDGHCEGHKNQQKS